MHARGAVLRPAPATFEGPPLAAPPCALPRCSSPSSLLPSFPLQAGPPTSGRTQTPSGPSASQSGLRMQDLGGAGRATTLPPRAPPSIQTRSPPTLPSCPLVRRGRRGGVAFRLCKGLGSRPPVAVEPFETKLAAVCVHRGALTGRGRGTINQLQLLGFCVANHAALRGPHCSPLCGPYPPAWLSLTTSMLPALCSPSTPPPISPYRVTQPPFSQAAAPASASATSLQSQRRVWLWSCCCAASASL